MANKLIQKDEEIDWENLKEEDLEPGEVHFEIARDAFGDKVPHCFNGHGKMERKIVRTDLIGTPFSAKIEAFVCKKCSERLLNGVQAQKLDDLMKLAMALNIRRVGIRRSLNYDGKSIFIRLPIELKKYRKKKARIFQLQEKKFLVEIE